MPSREMIADDLQEICNISPLKSRPREPICTGCDLTKLTRENASLWTGYVVKMKMCVVGMKVWVVKWVIERMMSETGVENRKAP